MGLGMVIPNLRTPLAFRQITGIVCLWWCMGGIQDAAAQEVPAVAAIPGVTNIVPTGISYVLPGGEVLIYSVELSEAAGGDDAGLKTVGVAPTEIRFTISNSGFGIVAAADITSFNFYRSADAVFDGGDLLLKSPAPGALPGAQTIDFGAPGAISLANADILVDPLSIFFLITASIAPGATIGHSFVLGTAANHIDLFDIPATDYDRGTLIAASDANRIEIGTAPVAPVFSDPGTAGEGAFALSALDVPLQGEWLILLIVVGCGIWTIRPPKPSDRADCTSEGTP